MGSKAPKSDPWADVLEQDEMVKMRDGFENRIRIYSPNSHSTGEAEVCKDREKEALLVLIHGGGFCVGNLEQEECNCRTWVRNQQGVAISIEHRLAPEAKFPVPVEDCWDALQ
jgi:acetyl esterase/lipase